MHECESKISNLPADPGAGRQELTLMDAHPIPANHQSAWPIRLLPSVAIGMLLWAGLLSCGLLSPNKVTEDLNQMKTEALLWTAWGRGDTSEFSGISVVKFDSLYFYRENDTNKYMAIAGKASHDTLYNFGRQTLEHGSFKIDGDSVTFSDRLCLMLRQGGGRYHQPSIHEVRNHLHKRQSCH